MRAVSSHLAGTLAGHGMAWRGVAGGAERLNRPHHFELSLLSEYEANHFRALVVVQKESSLGWMELRLGHFRRGSLVSRDRNNFWPTIADALHRERIRPTANAVGEKMPKSVAPGGGASRTPNEL